jgi:multicomponent Na+:H+ antiporter subunit B
MVELFAASWGMDRESWVMGVALLLLLASGVGICFARSHSALVVATGCFSLSSALLYFTLDAPDVAMTEVAVGAGAGTLLLNMALRVLPEASMMRIRPLSGWLIGFPLALTLMVALLTLPPLGSLLHPATAGVGRSYLEQVPVDIGIPNTVTAVLADYRGFDTLGETLVVLVALLAVVGVLRAGHTTPLPPREGEVSPILRVSVRLLLPFLWLYAAYVQWHGEVSPGGGFQAGVILAASGVLYVFTHGEAALHRWLRADALLRVGALGVSLYALIGVTGMLAGDGFLNYTWLGWTDSARGHRIGILLVEIGVCVTVAAAMFGMFLAFWREEV